jgi:hypothetical protein
MFDAFPGSKEKETVSRSTPESAEWLFVCMYGLLFVSCHPDMLQYSDAPDG